MYWSATQALGVLLDLNKFSVFSQSETKLKSWTS